MSGEAHTCLCGWKGDYAEYKTVHLLEAHSEKHDFACSCGDEGKARCDAMMEWALNFLSTYENGELAPKPTTRENLLTHVVYKLSWDYHAHITRIVNDQWSRVDSEGHFGDDDFKTFIQCDRVEDGIALTLRAWYDRFGPKRPYPEDEDEDEADEDGA